MPRVPPTPVPVSGPSRHQRDLSSAPAHLGQVKVHGRGACLLQDLEQWVGATSLCGHGCPDLVVVQSILQVMEDLVNVAAMNVSYYEKNCS